ncbi:MAG: HD-GYP domain-containing protein [Magnetococcales bacterium]|nr:HD-GYP domain-containing protein [Magnetococcales bacterium]
MAQRSTADASSTLDMETDGRTRAEIERELAAQLAALDEDDARSAETPSPPPGAVGDHSGPIDADLGAAATLFRHTNSLLGQSFEAVKRGDIPQLDPLQEATRELAASLRRQPDALLTLALLKRKNHYAYQHSLGASILLMALGDFQGATPAQISDLGLAGLLHDIGRMAIPDALWDKPDPFTDKERQLARQHVPATLEMLKKIPKLPKVVTEVAAWHHERLDGSGYPAGLWGEAIGPAGRMAAIVDIYDAMTTHRCYRGAVVPPLVLKTMLGQAGVQLDRDVLQAFIRCLGIYPIGSMVRLANNLLAVVIRSNREDLLFPTVRVFMDARTARRVAPYEINLAAMRELPGGFSILKHEVPSRWGVDPVQVMPRPDYFQL